MGVLRIKVNIYRVSDDDSSCPGLVSMSVVLDNSQRELYK